MDTRFRQEQGTVPFTGNELLLKGALETGVHLITGYPGSPVADIFDVCERESGLLEELGTLAQLANNEALAAARLNGTQQIGLRALAVMKSVGFHVAADALATGNQAKCGHRGGAVIVVGDDPWSDTTQAPVDSRRLCDHLFLPVVEPSDFQEIKDWIEKAFRFSEATDLYVCFLLTTYLAEGGGTVQVRPNRPPPPPTFRHPAEISVESLRPEHHVLLPPFTSKLEQETLRRKWPEAQEAMKTFQFQKIIPGRRSGDIAFVSSGAAFAYLIQALREAGLEGEFPVWKLGMTYPLDEKGLRKFLEATGAKVLVVVEEKRAFLETQIRALLAMWRETGLLPKPVSVWGKVLPEGLPGFPEAGGLSPAVVFKVLYPFLKKKIPTPKLDQEKHLLDELEKSQVRVEDRTATFCPGCPHRDTSSLFLQLVRDFKDPEYMRRRHGSGPIQVIFHGDAGCYSMLFLPPNTPLMHNYSGMGLGGGLGAGMSPFVRNKAVSFVGDSTFFHSGWTAISDAVKNNQDILFVILDNKTTAMTGHQPHPGMERDLMGRPTFAQDALKILDGMIARADVPVVRVNPEDRQGYRETLETLLLRPGVKVVVADKECGITFHRRKRRQEEKIKKEKGFLPVEEHIQIHSKTCEFCRECTLWTGCPGLTPVPTLYGPKMATEASTCVNDGACHRLKACPAFEKITIERKAPPPAPTFPNPEEIPDPKAVAWDEVYRVYLAGVGGMGIGTATAVLVRAGMHMGWQVCFGEKKGIAIRNGGVYAHLTFRKTPAVVSPVLPQGKADLLLGFDLLEAARGLDPRFPFRVASRAWTHAVVNTKAMPTVRQLMGKDAVREAQYAKALENGVKKVFFTDAAELSEKFLGHKRYLNMVVVGAAYQKGWLPFSLNTLRRSFAETFGKDADANWKAFTLGRHWAAFPENYAENAPPPSAEVALEGKLRLLRGKKRRLLRNWFHTFEALWKGGEGEKIQFLERAYDLLEYGGPGYAYRYVRRVFAALKREAKSENAPAARVILRALHHVMAIKDEVEVARLLTHPEKYAEDRRRWNVDEKRGDRIRYVHFNRPHFDLPFGIRLEFDIETRDWMLRILKHMRFLRKLLPNWHKKEKAFRDDYERLVDAFLSLEHPDLERWLPALEAPLAVRGFREVRWRAMDAERKRIEQLLPETIKTAGVFSMKKS